MYIDSGSNSVTGGPGSAPTSMDYFSGQICAASGTVTASTCIADFSRALLSESQIIGPQNNHWKANPNQPRSPNSEIHNLQIAKLHFNWKKILTPFSFFFPHRAIPPLTDIGQVPNQPITFYNDATATSRSEDSLVAYGWVEYMKNTSNPNWLALLPMTKAVVRGMDVVQSFMAQKRVTVQKFVVSGASKRGWAAWTVGAVDKRVVGIAPIVMPMGNMTPLIDAMFRVYGAWSFALNDYINAGVLSYLRTPQWDSLLSIIDPKSYYSRFSSLEKYVIASGGDEFFLPDSVRHWWKDLPSPKILRVVPNADHSFIEYAPGVAYGIATWVQRLQRDMSTPRFSWTLTYSNTTATIRATASGLYQPKTVNLYWVNTLSATTRDFRFLACQTSVACINPVGIGYTQERLTTLPGQNTWTVSMPAPAYGWTAFLIEAVYPGNYIDRYHSNPDDSIRITTEVNVVPDRYPFDYCENTNSCAPSA